MERWEEIQKEAHLLAMSMMIQRLMLSRVVLVLSEAEDEGESCF